MQLITGLLEARPLLGRGLDDFHSEGRCELNGGAIGVNLKHAPPQQWEHALVYLVFCQTSVENALTIDLVKRFTQAAHFHVSPSGLRTPLRETLFPIRLAR